MRSSRQAIWWRSKSLTNIQVYIEKLKRYHEGIKQAPGNDNNNKSLCAAFDTLEKSLEQLFFFFKPSHTLLSNLSGPGAQTRT